jgi:hypothetical protein
MLKADDAVSVDDVLSDIELIKQEFEEKQTSAENELIAISRGDRRTIKRSESRPPAKQIKDIKEYLDKNRHPFVSELLHDIGWFKVLELGDIQLIRLHFKDVSLETKAIFLKKSFLTNDYAANIMALRKETAINLAIPKMDFANIVCKEFDVGMNRALLLLDALIANGHFRYVKTDGISPTYKLIQPNGLKEVEIHSLHEKVIKLYEQMKGEKITAI